MHSQWLNTRFADAKFGCFKRASEVTMTFGAHQSERMDEIKKQYIDGTQGGSGTYTFRAAKIRSYSASVSPYARRHFLL